MSEFVSSLIEIVLFDHEVRNETDIFLAHDSSERQRFTRLGAVRRGSLIVEDDNGRRLYIDESAPATIVPLSELPIPCDGSLTPELAEIARGSVHALMFRETRFREKDTVRVRATVEIRERVVAGGYRDALERILVPTRGEPLVLREML